MANFWWILVIFCYFCGISRADSDQFNKPVSILWGLPDTGTVVGKLFGYRIPEDAFDGTIREFHVKDAVGDSLPKWLHWDREHATLIGIALDSDLGPHYISVEAVGLPLNDTHSSSAADVFTIHVREDSMKAIPGAAQKSRDILCDKGEEVITMMITISANLESLDALDRTRLLREAAKSLNVDIAHLRLWSVAYAASMKQEILAAGAGEPGAAMLAKGSVVGIRIGCGSSLQGEAAEKLAVLEKQLASPESFGKSFDNHVIGWTVSATKIEPRRRKRQFGREITPTPTIATPHPTYTASVEFTPTPLPTTTQRRTTRTAPPVIEPSTTPATWKPAQPTPDLPTRKPGDSTPSLVNSLGEIRCHVNTICYFEIQHDTFTDVEDGDTTKLTLTLMNQQESKIPADNWLTLKSFEKEGELKQVLKGLPTRKGDFRYILQARDSGSSIVTDAFMVTVDSILKDNQKFTHHFSLRLEDLYQEFAENISKQADLLERISAFYEDHRPVYITMGTVERGSVMVSWSNNTIATDFCDHDAIDALKRKIFRAADDKVKREFQQYMEPAFKVTDVRLTLSGHCDHSTHDPAGKGGKTGAEATTEPPKDASDSTMITTVIPIVVIVVLLIIAALIVCILYRKKNKKKQSSGGGGQNGSFSGQGKPVIFPNEMDEKEKDVQRPLIQKEERPPQPMPEFRHSNGGGSLQREAETPLLAEDSEQYPQYQRPPPPPAETGTAQTPRQPVQSQRPPPPYVSP